VKYLTLKGECNAIFNSKDFALFSGGDIMGRDVGNDRFIEITTHSARTNGHKIYIHKKTGVKVRLDLPKTDQRTGKTTDKHWHVENPNSQGNSDKYYGKNGEITNHNDPNAHLTEEEMYTIIDMIEGGSK
jgi:hypothetical protein